MLLLFYKILLTLSATSWMVAIYVISNSLTPKQIPSRLFGILLLLLSILLASALLRLFRHLPKETPFHNSKEIELADGEFLPTYLGYFFISVGVSDHFTMIVLYLIVSVFTFLSQSQYYNPIFLFFGYHFYHISTEVGTKIFVIQKGEIIRNPKDFSPNTLYRLNNSTFIGR